MCQNCVFDGVCLAGDRIHRRVVNRCHRPATGCRKVRSGDDRHSNSEQGDQELSRHCANLSVNISGCLQPFYTAGC